MIDFSKYDKEFVVGVDTGFWPLVIFKKTTPITHTEELTISEAFERSKRTGEAFTSEYMLSGAKLLKELNDELGREIDTYMNIAILNYGRKDPIQYNGTNKYVKSATHTANLILGLEENDLQDDVDLIGKSSIWLAETLKDVIEAQKY